MVGSPGHPELFVEKKKRKKMLKKVWSYTVDFVLGSEPYVTILHRECYRTLRYIIMDTTTDHFTPLALRVRGNKRRSRLVAALE